MAVEIMTLEQLVAACGPPKSQVASEVDRSAVLVSLPGIPAERHGRLGAEGFGGGTTQVARLDRGIGADEPRFNHALRNLALDSRCDRGAASSSTLAAAEHAESRDLARLAKRAGTPHHAV